MDDTVGDEHVRQDDAGLVHVDSAVLHNDIHLRALNSLDGGILESSAISDSAADDVVGEHAGKILSSQVGERGGDGRESTVVRRKDGDVRETAKGVNEVGLGHGSSNGSEISLDGGFGNALGDAEDGVDDVDDTTGESNILFMLAID